MVTDDRKLGTLIGNQGTHPLLPNSVRITTKASYNGALVIGDFWKFAHGPTIWPAFWGEFLPYVYERNSMLMSVATPAVGYVTFCLMQEK